MTNEEKQKLLDELRPKGEWIEHKDLWRKTCSVCEFRWKNVEEFNFCPNCGSDMRGTRK